MPSFIVTVREVHVQQVRVKDAKDAEHAKKKVVEGGGKYLDHTFEFSHMLDSETWTVKEEQ